MSPSDPRFPSPDDPAAGENPAPPASGGEEEGDAEGQPDRLAGFFDEAVRDPDAGPRPADQGDLLIVRNMNDEFAAAQAAADARRAESPEPAAEDHRDASPEPADDDLGLMGNSPPQATAPAGAVQRPESSPPQAAAPPAPDPSPEPEPVAGETQPAPEPSPVEEPPAAEEPPRPRAEFLEPDLRPSRKPEPLEPAPPPPVRRIRPRRRARPAPPLGSTVALIAGGALLVLATALASGRVEPFHTWYYVFAWYPFLAAINYLTAMRSREHSVFAGRWKAIGAMLAWSVPVWLVFEAFNFRLADWYYVGVPRELLWRRLGVIVSFATVLPGVLLLEELGRVHGLFAKLRTRAFAWTRRLDRIVLGVGAAWTVLVLALPHFAYPLLWGVPVLLLEPWLRRGDGPSLAKDLAAGRPGRILRLLGAGMVCGLWWEAANTVAGGKWIYTVPGLDALRPFEMPLLGFIGFAPFALCLWSMARALVRLGLLPDWEQVAGGTGEAEAEAHGAEADATSATPADAEADATTEPSPDAASGADTEAGTDAAAAAPGLLRGRRKPLAVAAAAGLSLLTLAGMDRWTVDSFTAHAADVPGIPDGIPEYAVEQHLDSPRGLLRLIAEGKLYVPGESNAVMLDHLQNACRLSILDEIGTDNAGRLIAAGIGSVEALAASDPAELTARLGALDEPGWHPRPRRVAEWIRAARRETSAGQ